MHQPWRTFASLINQGLFGKTSGFDKLRLFRSQILWGAVPPKIARKFKKSSPSKKDSDLVLVNEEPIPKGKRIKRSVKKSSSKPATGFFIREPSKETKSKRKEKGNYEDDSNDENDSENKDKDEENKIDDNKTPSDSEKGSDFEQDLDGSKSDSEFVQQEYDDDELKDDDEDDDDDDKFKG
nr:hypothetical protein [Tanacetum cinerariifolium]